MARENRGKFHTGAGGKFAGGETAVASLERAGVLRLLVELWKGGALHRAALKRTGSVCEF